MEKVKFVVLVDPDKKKSIDAIADDLSDAGLAIDRKMSITGIISGWASAEEIDKFRKVDGVAELRQETYFSLPPMDDKIPQ